MLDSYGTITEASEQPSQKDGAPPSADCLSVMAVGSGEGLETGPSGN